jgi:predicted phage tail protein
LGEVEGVVFDTVLGGVLIPVVMSVLLAWGVCVGDATGLVLLLGVGVPLEPDGVTTVVAELVVPEDESTDVADEPDEEPVEEEQIEEEDEPPFGFEMPNCTEY